MDGEQNDTLLTLALLSFLKDLGVEVCLGCVEMLIRGGCLLVVSLCPGAVVGPVEVVGPGEVVGHQPV